MNMNQVVLTYSSAIRIVASVMTGFGISSIVFLVLTAQVWIYFRRDTIRSVENRLSKALVAFIWLIQAVQMAVATWISFAHALKFNMTLGQMLINLALYNGMSSLTTSVVHGVFISRVFRLEKSLYGKRRITFVLIAFCVMEQVFGVLSTIYISRISHYNLNVVVNWSTLVSLGCSAIDDVLIAGTTAYILYKHRTESPRTNRMITKLIIFCSQTGLITTQVPLYWQCIYTHCFLCSVVASITMGIVSAHRAQ
ncbi:hypothetical protein EV424DRAFT_750494 [Suillus variegatus]|nr:hypothetical protein EV424DRAFT_750494 [Suillus variegatus]